ncbi:Anaphase-promoting complex subunit 8 [Thecaphora frezii]
MSVYHVDRQFADLDPVQARYALRSAAKELRHRGLVAASKWALELLQCVPRPSSAVATEAPEFRLRPHLVPTAPASTPATRRSHTLRPGHFPEHSTPALGLHQQQHRLDAGDDSYDVSGRFAPPPRFPPSPLANVSHITDPDASSVSIESDGIGSAHVHWQSTNNSYSCSPGPSRLVHDTDDEDRDDDDDIYALAKSYFDQHQLERAAWLLEERGCKSDKATFLKLYARFLVSERKLDEHGMIIPRPNGKMPATSPDLVSLLKELVDPSDPFLLFLKGAILRKIHRPVESMDCLIRSVQAFPYNWAAWQELSITLEPGEADEIADLLPDTFMASFFREFTDRHAAQEGDKSIERIDKLLEHFPDSAYLLTCRAQTHVHRLDYIEAEQDFQQAWSIDPYRIDGLSDYSNVLYLLNRSAELAQLAHKFSTFGKDRPEVCCLVGNYYNQRSDHHRAIESFRHALRLDAGCVPAWILLGHEYIELKNSHAAAEMYRRALEINPREYRALYGLGQVYELNGAYTYAVHYFQKCAAIRPYDGRMWSSMGVCFDQLGRSHDAIACFKRYLTCRLNHGDTVLGLTRIIEVYEKERDFEAAASYHRRLVQVVDRGLAGTEANVVARYVQSYIIAARWEMGEIGNPGWTRALEQQQQRTQSNDQEKGKGLGRKEEDVFMLDSNKLPSGGLASLDKHASSSSAAAAAGEGGGNANASTEMVGNLALANDYLQKVIAAGTEMTDIAEMLLKRLAFLQN